MSYTPKIWVDGEIIYHQDLNNIEQGIKDAHDEISLKPDSSELGSAAFKDVPTVGDASSEQVVLGSDTRMSNARPASDVSAWAKQLTKPLYDYSEIVNTPDLSGFITKSVNDLTNYYLKSETYTKAEVAALIGAIQQFHYEIYQTLPSSGESNVLYLIGPTGSGADRYEEYVYANNDFTKIGDTSIDLSGYVTTSALNTALADYTTTSNLTALLSNKADKVSNATNGNFAGLDANGNLTDSGKKASDFATASQGAKADTAYQKPSIGIPESDLSSDVQQALKKHFKGWYASSSSLPANPVVGDYAYVKGAESTDPAAIYECTTNGSWSDSGRTADTSNVQTFQTGEDVNEIPIDNTNLVNPAEGALAVAQDVDLYRTFPFTVTNGGITNTGNRVIINAYTLSDYIPIVGGEHIYCYGTQSYTHLQFYDGNKNFISTIVPESSAYALIVLDDSNIPTNAVYFRAGTLNSTNGLTKSYIKQPRSKSVDFMQKYTDSMLRIQQNATKVDEVLSYANYTVTNKRLELTIELQYESAYVMLECQSPIGTTFEIRRKTKYSGVNPTSYLNNCRYNEWIRVDKDAINGNYLYFYRSVTSESTSTPVRVIFKSLKASIEQRIDNLEKIRSNMANKNIVVFGDSLSEFVGNDGKSWVDHTAEITEANFINCSLGGTQIKQRSKITTLFDSTKSYAVGDWVFYKPSTTMNWYECTNAHSGGWSDDDFTEKDYNTYLYAQLDIVSIVTSICNTNIAQYADRFVDLDAAVSCIVNHSIGNPDTKNIAALKNIDWSTIDAVVIMAGANDFGVQSFGDIDSTDKMKESGAINEIVRMLSSTYKKTAIYFSSDTVRWFKYNSGTISDDNWGDVYHATEGGVTGALTYKEWTEAIINQFKLHHIPTIDLYNTLGWNKWNFSEYFPTGDPSYDGTHPRKGFRQIAEKIVSFIVANKVFK